MRGFLRGAQHSPRPYRRAPHPVSASEHVTRPPARDAVTSLVYKGGKSQKTWAGPHAVPVSSGGEGIPSWIGGPFASEACCLPQDDLTDQDTKQTAVTHLRLWVGDVDPWGMLTYQLPWSSQPCLPNEEARLHQPGQQRIEQRLEPGHQDWPAAGASFPAPTPCQASPCSPPGWETAPLPVPQPPCV